MSAQTVTAISAVAIAVASLFVSIWTSVATRKHQRLSVVPHLKIDYFHRLHEPLKITLVNNGLGTAIIKEFQVLLDGVPLSGGLTDALSQALPIIGLAGTLFSYTPTVDDALSAGEQVVMISLDLADNQPKEALMLRKPLARVVFEISYESMYGDKFVLARNALGRQGEAEQIVGRERR